MIARLTDRVLDKLLGGTTAQACLCLPHCTSRCVSFSPCSNLGRLVTCTRCNCDRTSSISGCC